MQQDTEDAPAFSDRTPPPKTQKTDRKVTGGILYFKGEKKPLSNLFLLKNPIRFRGHSFNSTENAYQWAKATEHNLPYLANKILSESSRNAMYIGKKIKTNEAWRAKKLRLMTELVLLKRDSSQEYKDYLLSTTNATLIEQTNHEYWGEGKQKKGKNYLGMIHTEVRENLFQHLKTNL